MAWTDRQTSEAAHLGKVNGQLAHAHAQIRADLQSGRRALFKPAPDGPGRSDNVLEERVAEELELAVRELGQVGDALAADPLVATRYAPQLRLLQRVRQVIGHLGRVIGARDKAMAVDRITFSEVRARLKRRALRAISD